MVTGNEVRCREIEVLMWLDYLVHASLTRTIIYRSVSLLSLIQVPLPAAIRIYYG